MRKLNSEIIKVKEFDVVYKDELFIVKCDCKICMILYPNNFYVVSEKELEFKDILKWLIRNINDSLKKVNFLFNTSINNHYEVCYHNNYFGELIIPKKYKQKPKDFLKEILFSKYNIKMYEL